ncbi:MAG: sugar-binding domain-containing protein [Terricaulis sp.]
MFSWGVTVQPREVIVVEITRRTLLETSAVGVLAAGAGGGAAESALAQPARAGEGARQRLLLDFDWRFALGHASDVARDFGFGENQRTFAKQGTRVAAAAAEDFDDTAWRAIRLPHDWAVELPFAPSRDRDPSAPDDPRAEHGFKPLGRDYPDTSVGWYRKSFDLPESDLGKRLSLEFDGVFRDCLVIFNGYIVARNESGYAPFSVDVTDFANYGAKNTITLRVDATLGEGWFYEGAGVYRHVWLVKTDPLHIPQWGVKVTSTPAPGGRALIVVNMDVAHAGDGTRDFTIEAIVRDARGVEQARMRGEGSGAGRSHVPANAGGRPHDGAFVVSR